MSKLLAAADLLINVLNPIFRTNHLFVSAVFVKSRFSVASKALVPPHASMSFPRKENMMTKV